MSEYGDRLKVEYDGLRPVYEKFTDELSGLLERWLTDAGIKHLPIERRTKDGNSLLSKVERPEKSQKYLSCRDITDLSGVRIITYIQEDHDKVCDLIEKNLSIDTVNSIEKHKILDENQFGYRSSHYVASYTDGRAAMPESAKFAGLKAEIQVRTLLQHTWAAIDWKLRYKNTFEAPKELRRRLFRISALLELADDEFSGLSQAIDAIRTSYQDKMSVGDLRIDIDNESIEIFVNQNETVRDLMTSAEGFGYNISPFQPGSRNPYLALLQTISIIGVSRIDELERIISDGLVSGNEKLKSVFDEWNTPGKPAKLVIDAANIVRLFVVLASAKGKAKAALSNIPFGPELQRALTHVVG